VTSDGSTRQHSLNANFSLSLARVYTGPGGAPVPVLINGRGADGPPPPPPPGLLQNPANRRFDWRRLNFNGNYSFGHQVTNVEGPFATPATGSIENEWGPSAGDVRHRFNLGINSSQLRNLN